MKRIATLVIPCIIMSCILTACSKNEATNTSDEVSTQETSEKAKATPQPTAASAVVTPFATSPAASATVTPAAEAVITYQDGSYEATTAPDYEGYYVKATVAIEDGKITKADWTIYDSNHNDKPFDESYKSVFEGNDYYMQQCIDDWNGSRSYSEDLINSQSLEEVDAVSGATWTCSKFKEGIIAALGQAITD